MSNETQTEDVKTPELVTEAPAPAQALATAGATQLQVRTDLPDFLQNIPLGNEGTEGIEKEDMRMPRIGLAQGLSPEINPEKPRYIDGLKLGQMFNSVTKELYGKGPLEFQVLRAERPRYIEFRDRKEGGGVIDMDVPPNDPRTLFTKNEAGESVPPKATKFFDYIIRILRPDGTWELASISFKGIMLKDALGFNTLIKLRNAPVYAGKYTLTAIMDKNTKGDYAIYKVVNSETLDENTSRKGWVSKKLFEEGAQMFKALSTKTIDIDRGDPEEAGGTGGGDTSFPHGANVDPAGVADI